MVRYGLDLRHVSRRLSYLRADALVVRSSKEVMLPVCGPTYRDIDGTGGEVEPDTIIRPVYPGLKLMANSC
jgi:hypothetical protein